MTLHRPRLASLGARGTIALAVSLTLTACGGSAKVGRAHDTPAERELRTRLVSAGPLVSAQISGTDDLPTDAPLQLRITPTGAGVSGGCNDHRGPLDIEGDVLRFIGGPSQTLVGCDDERVQRDEWIVDLLSDGAHAQRTSDGGVILRRGDTAVRFVRERPLLRKAEAARRRALRAMTPQPWALLGTERRGRRLEVRALAPPGRCKRIEGMIEETSRVIRLKVGVIPGRCRSLTPEQLEREALLRFQLRTSLRGRLVTGPKLQQATLFNRTLRRPGERFTVPDLTGLRVGQAQTVARNTNTRIEIYGRKPRGPTDFVVDQRPYPGLFPSPHRRTHSSVINIKRPLPIEVAVRPRQRGR